MAKNTTIFKLLQNFISQEEMYEVLAEAQFKNEESILVQIAFPVDDGSFRYIKFYRI